MPKPRKTAKLPPPRPDNLVYDIAHLTSIVGAMDFLRTEARKAKVAEVTTVIESAFNLLRLSHDRLLPHHSVKLPVDKPDTGAAGGASGSQPLESVVSAMDYLRTEARKAGIEEIVTIVESAFNIVCAAYYCILRYDMMTLPPSDEPFPHGA